MLSRNGLYRVATLSQGLQNCLALISSSFFFQGDAIRNYYHERHVIQDMLVPSYKVGMALEFSDREFEVTLLIALQPMLRGIVCRLPGSRFLSQCSKRGCPVILPLI